MPIPPPLGFIHIPPPQTLPICLLIILFSAQQLPIIPQSFLERELCLLALNRKLTIPLSAASLRYVLRLPGWSSLYSPWTHLTSAQPIATLAYPSSSFPHLRPGDPTWFFPFFTSTCKPSEVPVDFTFKLYSWGSLPLSLCPQLPG